MATCPANSTLGVCDTLNEAGNGLGVFLDAIKTPLGTFIFYIAIIGAVVALVLGVAYLIRKVATKHL